MNIYQNFYMKYLFYLGVLMVALGSCNKKTCSDGIKNQDEADVDCGGSCNACPIEYPIEGAYGSNILLGTDSLNLSVGDHSFRATLLEGSSLKIELELITGFEWFYSNDGGWTVGTYMNGLQFFELLSPGTYDLNFNLFKPIPTPEGGTFYIKYYENGSASSKSKHVTWS